MDDQRDYSEELAVERQWREEQIAEYETEQYRYESGHLFELQGAAYVHCYTCRSNLTKRQAIALHEAR